MTSCGRVRPLDSGYPSERDSIAEIAARFCVASLIVIGILVPPINITSSLWVRPEQVLLPLVFGLYLWLLLAGYARPIRWNGIFLVGALFCSSVLLSAWYGSIALHHTVILRDFYDLPKALFPVAFFTLALEANLLETSLRRVLTFFSAAIFLVCLYAWAQWMNLGFTHSLNAYYSALNHDSTLFYARRVYSTLGNPNHLGQLMSWSLAAFLLALLFRVGNRFRNIFLVLATLVTLVMTGSRYALLDGAAGVLLIFLFSITSKHIRKRHLRTLLVALPLLIIAFAVVASSNKLTLDRYKTVEHPLEVDSLRARLDRMWLAPWADFVKSPLLGNGPAKSIYTGTITDSEYLDVLKNFGLVGFLPYMAYFLFPLVVMWKGLKAERKSYAPLENQIPAMLLTMRLGFIIGATSLIMNTGMSTFNNLSLQSFIWIWMGLGARSAMTIRENATAELVRPYAFPPTAQGVPLARSSRQ